MPKASARATLVLFCLAGLLYNSWPLGFILNNMTAHTAMASDLDAPGQPYNWVFIAGDMIVGLILLIAALLMRTQVRSKHWSSTLKVVMFGCLIFGVFTATATLPSHCPGSSGPACSSIKDWIFGPDALESTVAGIALFAAMIASIKLPRHYKLSSVSNLLAKLVLVAWLVSSIYLIATAAFNRYDLLAQQLFIVITGLSLAILGLNIYAAVRSAKRPHEPLVGDK